MTVYLLSYFNFSTLAFKLCDWLMNSWVNLPASWSTNITFDGRNSTGVSRKGNGNCYIPIVSSMLHVFWCISFLVSRCSIFTGVSVRFRVVSITSIMGKSFYSEHFKTKVSTTLISYNLTANTVCVSSSSRLGSFEI